MVMHDFKPEDDRVIGRSMQHSVELDTDEIALIRSTTGTQFDCCKYDCVGGAMSRKGASTVHSASVMFCEPSIDGVDVKS